MSSESLINKLQKFLTDNDIKIEQDLLSTSLRELNFTQTLSLIDNLKVNDKDAVLELLNINAPVDESQLDELNLLAPERLYIRMPDNTYKKVDYRNTTSLHGPTNDGATSIKINDVDDAVIKKLDLDARLDYNNKKPDGTAYKKSNTLAIGHDHQGGLPVSDPDIMVYDFDSDEYNNNVSKKIAGKLVKDIDEAYGTVGTQQPSASTIKAQTTKDNNNQRDFTNAQQDQQRDATGTQRTVAGGNKQATGQGAARSVGVDPDDVQRGQNAAQSNANAELSNQNAAEIERLKQLAYGRR